MVQVLVENWLFPRAVRKRGSWPKTHSHLAMGPRSLSSYPCVPALLLEVSLSVWVAWKPQNVLALGTVGFGHRAEIFRSPPPPTGICVLVSIDIWHFGITPGLKGLSYILRNKLICISFLSFTFLPVPSLSVIFGQGLFLRFLGL